MSDFIIKDGELYHHGVKGMRWGVITKKRPTSGERRLTRAKAKAKKEKDKAKLAKTKADIEKSKAETRQQKIQAKIYKMEARRNKSKKNSGDELDKKDIKDMTTAEIKAKTERVKAENDLKKAQNEHDTLHPAKISAGKKIFNKIWPRVEKVALDVGEEYAKSQLKDTLGITTTEPNYENLLKKLKYEDELEKRRMKKKKKNP